MAVKKNISEVPLLRHYDKLLVVIALVALLVSLAYLINASMGHEQRVADVERAIGGLEPKNPRVDAMEMAAYGEATRLLDEPFVMAVVDPKTANYLTPERRAECGNASCKKPITFEAEKCPFCGEKQGPKELPEFYATVGEVPDVIKIALGLPVNDVSVENRDLWNDGFTVLEKWKVFQSSLTNNPAARPPYTAKLELKAFKGKKLTMRFTGINKMPDGNFQIVLNWTDPKNRRTLWVKENQPIADGNFKTGYTTGKLTEKYEDVEVPVKKRVNVSTITVKRDSDGKEFDLLFDDKEINTDVEAVLGFLVDNTERVVLPKQEFTLRDETYRVVSINEKDATVEVEDAESGEKTIIKK